MKHTAVGVYSLKQVWQQSSAKHGIKWGLKQDARLVQELARSQLPLSARELQPILLASIQALVDSFKVSVKFWLVGDLLHVEGGGSGRVWGCFELLAAAVVEAFSTCAHAHYKHCTTHPPTHPLTHSLMFCIVLNPVTQRSDAICTSLPAGPFCYNSTPTQGTPGQHTFTACLSGAGRCHVSSCCQD